MSLIICPMRYVSIAHYLKIGLKMENIVTREYCELVVSIGLTRRVTHPHTSRVQLSTEMPDWLNESVTKTSYVISGSVYYMFIFFDVT